MSEKDFHQFSYGKSGQGLYGQSMGTQEHAVLEWIKDRIFKALDSIPVHNKDKSLFTIADVGSADGCGSMPLMTGLIERTRNMHGEIPIQIVYEDQACNDFNSLFRRVHGIIPDQHTYLKRFSQVYTMASGTSFFDQVLPNDTAHLILCFAAAHYLSVLPTKFQNSLHRFPDATDGEKRLVEARAAKDWETFLWQRAKELKSGGVLIVTTPCDDPEMKMDGVRHAVQGYEETMLKTWRQMRDEGKITQNEFLDTNFQRCTQHQHEVTAPLQDSDSKVYKAGLRLVQADTFLVPCVHQRHWQQKLDEEGVDTRESWARTVASQHRVWTNNIFHQGLAGWRSQQEKESLVNELYERLEKEVLAQGPREFKNKSFRNYLCARKL